LQSDSDVTNILNFWFGETPETQNQHRKKWFAKSPDFDREIRSQFLRLHQQAAAGQLGFWQTTPESCLALIIVLDQFSRNLFRDHPQAFANDTQALQAAQQAIDLGFDLQLTPQHCAFLYMPFMHSEDLSAQERSIVLFKKLAALPETQSYFDYAIRHFQVIQQFGRFPHRNQILGRVSSPAEVEFLQQPGSRF
jgi:uncharacterized protein (DUF924 family)